MTIASPARFRLAAIAMGALALASLPMTARVAEAAPDSAANSDGLLRHDIAASTADPAAHQPPNALTHQADLHLVLTPADAARRKNRLFLFIPGTNTATAMAQDIVKVAATSGYNAISLAYPNGQAVAALCRNAPDDDCTGKVREEMLTGRDVSPLVTVAPADAIETRLAKVLAFLKATYPTEGWGAFLGPEGVNWGMISVAGHSQGAGHVAMLAQRHAVLRAVMISGVADVTAAGRTAPWLSRPGATPAAREYGFSHMEDPIVPLAVARASWDAMGLGAFGPPRSVERQSPPYLGSHELISARPAGMGMTVHLSMAFDRFLPRDADGAPAYAPVWRFVALP